MPIANISPGFSTCYTYTPYYLRDALSGEKTRICVEDSHVGTSPPQVEKHERAASDAHGRKTPHVKPEGAGVHVLK